MENRVAAIWARISEKRQSELSLDSQVGEVKPWLEEMGYVVPEDRIIAVDWGSLFLMDCPDMEMLLGWIRRREIGAVGMLDRDRLHSEPAHKLLFIEECEKHGVKVLAKYGPPLLEGDEGKLMEHVLTLGKKKQVLRAQIGARIGLRDRPKRCKLPAAPKKIYGYRWDGGKFVPDEDYALVCEIYSLAMEMAQPTVRGIAAEMTRRGRLTFRGKSVWHPASVNYILRNPVYGGRVPAMRWEAVEPRQRRSRSYGKSSSHQRRREEWLWLDGLVLKHPVTWVQWLWIQERFNSNRQFAKRRGRGYLLRGLIECQLCHRRYTGQTKDGRPYYRCAGRYHLPWGAERCCGSQLGTRVEEDVWRKVTAYLLKPEVYAGQVAARAQAKDYTRGSIERTLRELDKRLKANLQAKQEAFRQRIRGKVDDDVYDRELALLRAERVWLT
jgi:hypothetical protein